MLFAVFHAVGALERINTAETRAALGDLLTTDQAHAEDEILVRIHAIESLGHGGDASYQRLISRYLEDKDEHITFSWLPGWRSHSWERQTPHLGCNAHPP
jgi:hypothetical protein